VVVIGLCVLIIPIGFVLGRWSVSTKPSSAWPSVQTFRSEGRSSANAAPAAERDFSNVTIENLGQVEFDHAFELLRSASKEALTAWTRRLETLPVAPRKTAAITVFFKTLAQIDTKTAVDLALNIERAGPRWTAIGAVDVAAPLATLPEIARMYTTINETKQPLVGDLIAKWSMTDPEATAEFLASYPGTVTNDQIAPFIGNWAALDPAAAARWLAQSDPSRRSQEVYQDFYAGWMQKDRAAALRDLAERASDKTFKKAIKAASQNLFIDSPDAARSFVLMLPTAAQKAAVDQITVHITGIFLGGGDPIHLQADEVTKWVYSLPDDLWREQIGYVIDRWAEGDSGAVDTWLSQLPPQTKDRLLAEQCLAFNWNSPTTGFKAGLQIRDRWLREKTFREVFKDKVEEGKRELLERAELSGAEAAELDRIVKSL
jgi:hypothetical protein